MIDIKAGDYILTTHPHYMNNYAVYHVEKVTAQRFRGYWLNNRYITHNEKELSTRARNDVMGVFKSEGAAMSAAMGMADRQSIFIKKQKALLIAHRQATLDLLKED